MKIVRSVMSIIVMPCACAGHAGASGQQTMHGDAIAPVQAWLTTSGHAQALARQADIVAGKDDARLPIPIDVDAQRRYQTMVGFGAPSPMPLPGRCASAWNEAARTALLRDLFGPPPGIGLGFTRLTIAASDFSRSHYSLDDMPKDETDPYLAHFSIDANRADAIPITRQALAIKPQLEVMVSPWSAPGWMKTTDSLIQGTLRPEFYEAFSRYGHRQRGVPQCRRRIGRVGGVEFGGGMGVNSAFRRARLRSAMRCLRKVSRLS